MQCLPFRHCVRKLHTTQFNLVAVPEVALASCLTVGGIRSFRWQRSLGVPGCWHMAEGAWELVCQVETISPPQQRPVQGTPAAGLVASRRSLGVGWVWNILIGRKQTAGHFVKGENR